MNLSVQKVSDYLRTAAVPITSRLALWPASNTAAADARQFELPAGQQHQAFWRILRAGHVAQHALEGLMLAGSTLLALTLSLARHLPDASMGRDALSAQEWQRDTMKTSRPGEDR